MRVRVIALVSAFFFLALLFASPVAAHADETTSPRRARRRPGSRPPRRPRAPTSASRSGTTPSWTTTASPTPVPGVTITVDDAEGTEVGSGVTDVAGRVFIPIPGNGTYTVKLDDGHAARGHRAQRQRRHREAGLGPHRGRQLRPVPDRGRGWGRARRSSSKLKPALLSGIKFGLIIALAALGLSMVFGTTGLTNFAHGELITFGALATYFFNVTIGHAGHLGRPAGDDRRRRLRLPQRPAAVETAAPSRHRPDRDDDRLDRSRPVPALDLPVLLRGSHPHPRRVRRAGAGELRPDRPGAQGGRDHRSSRW